ncbi:hypothetical protein H480_19213 [Amycolatopsis vancoresmycina DSM 44592]|uniref:Uncharacterized protein n=1 Tax=Amycolatopsis vancoresmycina DSM 44592 TaxID=1292037 RepID=R1I8Z7_9PSEU|nr:hypothetical protein H480_19213 [Amycolatopsis vancoresmycina DSM 44592]
MFDHLRGDEQAIAAPGLLVCHRCSSQIRAAVDYLGRIYDGLQDVDELTPGGHPDGAGSNTVPGPRSPAVDALLVHSDPRSFADVGDHPAALATIAGWARFIREERAHDLAPAQLRATVPAGRISMERELATIRFHWDWLMSLPIVLRLEAEVNELITGLELVRRLNPPPIRIGKCPVVTAIEPLPDGGELPLLCGTSLRVRPDDVEVRCRSCHTVWPRARWHELGDPWADYPHLSAELGVTLGTLKRWASTDGWRSKRSATSGTGVRRLFLRADALASYERYRGPLLGQAG